MPDERQGHPDQRDLPGRRIVLDRALPHHRADPVPVLVRARRGQLGHGREEWTEPRMITIELGLEMEHAALRFWNALATDDLDRLRRERAERDPRD